MRTLALVPVRKGSKGCPGKNTRSFAGRPLFAWAVSIGRATCDAVYVTTDDAELEFLTGMYGGSTILRPAELATDTTPMLPVVQHALKQFSADPPDVIVLLQPTSPWRTEKHVREALRLLEETGADSVASVVEIPAIHSPEYALTMSLGRLAPFNRETPSLDEMVTHRQAANRTFTRDGTVYAIRRETIINGSLYGRDCQGYIIPPHESVTLDTEADWARAVQATAHTAKVL